MHILVVGVNHHTAPVDIRERLTFQDNDKQEALEKLQNMKSVLEGVILSTCNRTEIYVVADQLHTGRYYVKSFLSEWFNFDMESLSSYLFIKENDQAIEHLFRVSCGLDSMVIGETQILGQVRDAFMLAQEEKTTGTVFNELFKQAITLAKRAHSEVMINENAVSVSYAAVELAKKIFGDLFDKHILIAGAGKMSELTMKHLYSQGVRKITVMNRTFDRAIELAERFEGVPKSLDAISDVLIDADILISSTGSRDYILTKETTGHILKERKGKPLFMVDIAVPRDLDPGINEIDGVFLYDIDDLEGIVEANLAERQEEAKKIELMMEETLVLFKQWLDTLGVVPIISALRQKAIAIQQDTMESILRKIPDLDEREKKVISKHTKSIVNQLLKDPILRVKEYAGQEGSEHALDHFIQIFSIEDEVQEEKIKQFKKKIAETSEREVEQRRLDVGVGLSEIPIRS